MADVRLYHERAGQYGVGGFWSGRHGAGMYIHCLLTCVLIRVLICVLICVLVWEDSGLADMALVYIYIVFVGLV